MKILLKEKYVYKNKTLKILIFIKYVYLKCVTFY